MTKRLPSGEFCGGIMPLALVMTLFYALPRYALDCRRERRAAKRGA